MRKFAISVLSLALFSLVGYLPDTTTKVATAETPTLESVNAKIVQVAEKIDTVKSPDAVKAPSDIDAKVQALSDKVDALAAKVDALADVCQKCVKAQQAIQQPTQSTRVSDVSQQSAVQSTRQLVFPPQAQLQTTCVNGVCRPSYSANGPCTMGSCPNGVCSTPGACGLSESCGSFGSCQQGSGITYFYPQQSTMYYSYGSGPMYYSSDDSGSCSSDSSGGGCGSGSGRVGLLRRIFGRRRR